MNDRNGQNKHQQESMIAIPGPPAFPQKLRSILGVWCGGLVRWTGAGNA